MPTNPNSSNYLFAQQNRNDLLQNSMITTPTSPLNNNSNSINNINNNDNILPPMLPPAARENSIQNLLNNESSEEEEEDEESDDDSSSGDSPRHSSSGNPTRLPSPQGLLPFSSSSVRGANGLNDILLAAGLSDAPPSSPQRMEFESTSGQLGVHFVFVLLMFVWCVMNYVE